MTDADARQRGEKESWVFSGKTCTPAALYKRIFSLSAHDPNNVAGIDEDPSVVIVIRF